MSLNFNMGLPEWIFVITEFVCIVLHLVMHGKPVYLHRHQGIQRSFGIVVTFIILYWGGFFS